MDLATMSPVPLPSGDSTFVVPSSDQIVLSETDRSRLQTFIHTGQESARARTRAQVLLELGEGWSLAEVCRAFDVCRNTVVAVRARYAEVGWTRSCATSVRSAIAKRWPARSKPTSWPSRAAPSPTGTNTGPSASWPEKPSSWASSSASRRKPSELSSKKRAEALAP